MNSLAAPNAVRLATTSSLRSCSYRNGIHISSRAYNPYRPDPPELPKEPRRVIMKNLKFGRLAQAASAGVEGARRSLVETTTAAEASLGQNAFHSTTQASARPSARRNAPPQPSTSYGNSANAGYRNGKGAPVGLYALLGAGIVGGTGAWYSSSSRGEASEKSDEKAFANALSDTVRLPCIPYNTQRHCHDALTVYILFWQPYTPQEIDEVTGTYLPAPADDPSLPMQKRMELWVKSLQDRIVKAVEAEEASPIQGKLSPGQSHEMPGMFFRDSWLREQGGEGISCVLQNGRVFEKAGVNVSIVYGKLPPKAVESMTADHAGKFSGWYDGKTPLPYKACGISCVMHPWSPNVPTVHFNYRYFE